MKVFVLNNAVVFRPQFFFSVKITCENQLFSRFLHKKKTNSEICESSLSLLHVHVENFHLKGKFFNSETCPLHLPKNWNHSISHLKYALKNFEKPENLTSSRKQSVGILTFCGGLVSSFAAFARQGKKQCCASGKMKRRERERREAAKWNGGGHQISVLLRSGGGRSDLQHFDLLAAMMLDPLSFAAGAA